MLPDEELDAHGLLIVTGASLRAEVGDRPLAYELKEIAEDRLEGMLDLDPVVLVLSDLWYLNADLLHRHPTISVGGPSINALSAHLYRRLPNAMVIENQLLIQMDLDLEDLRAAIWGTNHELTARAIDLFVERGYLDRFLSAVAARAQS